jgi:hypothetical protein
LLVFEFGSLSLSSNYLLIFWHFTLQYLYGITLQDYDIGKRYISKPGFIGHCPLGTVEEGLACSEAPPPNPDPNPYLAENYEVMRWLNGSTPDCNAALPGSNLEPLKLTTNSVSFLGGFHPRLQSAVG